MLQVEVFKDAMMGQWHVNCKTERASLAFSTRFRFKLHNLIIFKLSSSVVYTRYENVNEKTKNENPNQR